jgi:hypothetical protein
MNMAEAILWYYEHSMVYVSAHHLQESLSNLTAHWNQQKGL